MGESVITTQVKIDGDVTPDFSGGWALVYKGETFILNTHTPQAAKDYTTRNSLIDLTFQSFIVSELKRYFFVELSEVEVGTMIIDKYVVPLRLKAADFIAYFNRVLQYYFGNTIVVEVATGTTLSDEVKDVDINYTYIWNAVPFFYDVYGLVWKLSKRNNVYYITVGNTVDTIADHVFQYGYQGGLLRVERQLQDAEIYNQLLGRGGTRNIPYRYFKKVDPNNPSFRGDPDACAELENVYFDRLLDINFRYYVKGWLRNPNRPVNPDYPTPSTPEPSDVQAHWAYQKGLTDTKFQPVEYVQDAASIAEYGVRQGKLEDNDDIFPTIQGIEVSPYGRIDEIVAVSAITDGDDSGVVEETDMANILQSITTQTGLPLEVFDFYGPEFSVPSDRRGEMRYTLFMSDDTTGAVEPNFAYASTINTDYTKVVAERVSDGEQFPVSAIPGGDTYKLKIHFAINKFPTDKQTTRSVGLQNVKLIASQTGQTDENPYCFRVWIKNVWQTTKGNDETALEYMKRVWEPILGDRLGNEAKIVFSSGWMTASSDYEFTIVDWPKFDQSKTINGVQSEWMLTLAKSDAELESTGKYIPNATSPKPVAGDYYYFIGIDMPHLYVVWNEKRLNATKQEALDTEAYANPTWAVELDPVRIQTLEGNEVTTLFSRLGIGKVIKIYDPRFTGGYNLSLAIRSMTITWREGAVMNPTVDIVLSENVLERIYSGGTILSPDAINARINNAIVQANSLAQRSYLSKEHDDAATGKLMFAAGASFGPYSAPAGSVAEEREGGNIDSGGNAEFESLRLRKFLEVPELRYNRTDISVGNQWRAPGGGIIADVTPDVDGQGNILNTGIINLKLEDGEIGKVAVDDICMGIFHDAINENSNAVADLDDSKGNFCFSGFFTTYFRITEVLGTNNSCLRYALRPTSASWSQTFHPCAQMHFVCYGNFDSVNHVDRQASRYSTLTYERYLKGVNTWEFSAYNVAAQFGDLSNLATLGLTGMTGYSSYIENLYMTGHIQQVDIPLHIGVDWNGQNMLASGDSVRMVFSVLQGFNNMNSQVSSWAIARDSGDATADAAWAQLTKVQNFNGTITLEYSDLGASGISTLFTVTAVMNDTAHTNVNYGFTLISSGAQGADAVLLDLNNENDTMLYDKEGNLLSGNVVTVATLYKGNTPVSSGVTYAISARSGVTQQQATISGNTVTVTGMQSVSSGYVDITATYGGQTYTVRLSLKRLVGDVKYDLLVSPDSIAYNTTTGDISTSQINIKVFRTAQNSSGGVTRAEATSLPTGWALKVDGTSVTYPGIGGYTISNIDAAALAGRSSYAITLVNGSNGVVDAETVPVNTVTNGSAGQAAVTYSLQPSVTAVKKDKAGNYSVNAVTCAKMKSEGNSAPAVTTDGVLKISIDGGAEANYPSGGVPTSGTGSFTQTVAFLLYVNGALVAKVTVPMIIDGDDGDEGKGGFSAYLSEAAHVFASGTTNAVRATDTFEVLVYQGATKLTYGTDFLIGTLTISPNTVTSAKMVATNNLNGTISIDVYAALDIQNGTVSILVTDANGNLLTTLTYSWSLAFRGQEGAKLRGPTQWVATQSYYSGETSDFQDIVLDGNQYFKCIADITGSSSNTNPGLDPTHWEPAVNMNFVASDVLFAKKSKIDNLVVDEIYTVDPNYNDYNPISIQKDTITIADSDPNSVNFKKDIITLTSGHLGSGSTGSSVNITNLSKSYSIPTPGGGVDLAHTATFASIPITGTNNAVTLPAISLSMPTLPSDTGIVCYYSIYIGDRLLESGSLAPNTTKSVGGGVFTLPVGTHAYKIVLSGSFYTTAEISSVKSLTITASGSSASATIAYSADFRTIATDGMQMSYGYEGIKLSSAGAKVIQGGNQYNMAGLSVYNNQLATVPKRIEFCTSYPPTEEAGVFYIKVTAQS